MFLHSAQKDVQDGIEEYCRDVEACIAALLETLERYCQTQNRDDVRTGLPTTHAAESAADDVRGQIEVLMFSRGVFPESRGEILQLLEKMDRVPNRAEDVLRMILEQRILIPEPFAPAVMEIARTCSRAVHAMLDAAKTLFGEYARAAEHVGKIDEIESAVDRLLGALIERIFDCDMEGYQKILLRDLVARLASTSDSAEAVGEHIRVMVAKRTL